MMERLVDRAEEVARMARERRLEQIAATLSDAGFAVDRNADSVILKGRMLAQRWLADPLVRFISRSFP